MIFQCFMRLFFLSIPIYIPLFVVDGAALSQSCISPKTSCSESNKADFFFFFFLTWHRDAIIFLYKFINYAHIFILLKSPVSVVKSFIITPQSNYSPFSFGENSRAD